LKKVIVTQKLTRDYIINNGFVSPEKVAYIYGMVTHREYFSAPAAKKLYGKDKNTFDICFVANKYMAMGVDKGYVSPNVPFVLVPGKNYDGFPTGCCIDAALHSVGVFCTDLLGQNEHFEHRKNIFLIPPDACVIAEGILEYYRAPEKLYQLSASGQAKFREVFDFHAQMQKRTAILEQCM
jgi:hypothetical protein